MALNGAGTRTSPFTLDDSEDEVYYELYKGSNHSSSSSLSVNLEHPPLPQPWGWSNESASNFNIQTLPIISFHLLSKANPHTGKRNGNVPLVLVVLLALSLVYPNAVILPWKIAYHNLKARKRENEDGKLKDRHWKMLVSNTLTGSMLLVLLPQEFPSFLFGLGRVMYRCTTAIPLLILLIMLHFRGWG